jgi:hypothetical protein
MDETPRPSPPDLDRARALLDAAGIALPEDEVVACAQGLGALQRLLDLVRVERRAP